MVEFVGADDWRTAGRPPVAIPVEIGQWMEESYRTGEVCRIPAVGEEQDLEDFTRMLRIYATRQGKRAKWQHFEKDGEPWIRFKMVDKRPYRTGLVSQKR